MKPTHLLTSALASLVASDGGFLLVRAESGHPTGGSAYWKDKLPEGATAFHERLAPAGRVGPLFPVLPFVAEQVRELPVAERAPLIKRARFLEAHHTMFVQYLEGRPVVREDEVTYYPAALRFEAEAFLDALGRLLVLLAARRPSGSGPLVLVWEDFQNAGQALLSWSMRFVAQGKPQGVVLVAAFRRRSHERDAQNDLWTPFLHHVEEKGLLLRLPVEPVPPESAPAKTAVESALPDDELWAHARTARALLALEDALTYYQELERRGTYAENVSLSLEFGEILLRLHLIDRASLPLNQALDRARKQRKKLLMIHALSLLCHLSILENNYKQARKYWQLAMERLAPEKNGREGRDETWHGLKVLQLFLHEAVLDGKWFGEEFVAVKAYYRERGWHNTLAFLESLIPYYRWRCESSGWQTAHEEAVDALARMHKLGNLYRESVLYHCLGFLHEYVGRKNEALAWFRKGIQLRKKLGDPVELIKVYNGTGYFNFTIGDFRQAAKYYKESLALLEQVRDFPEICLTLFNMTLIYFFSGNFSSALGFLETILEIMDSLGLEVLPWHRRPKLYALAGVCALHLGQLSLALEYFDKTTLAAVDAEAEPYCRLLDILVNQESLGKDKALAQFDRALAAVTAESVLYFRIHLLTERTLYLRSTGQKADLAEALSLARDHGLVNQVRLLEELQNGERFEVLGARFGRLPDRVTALISNLRSSARQEASGRRLLEKIHEVNFLRNFQTQLTSGQDADSLFRKALELVRGQFLLQAGVVWRGSGDQRVPVQAFGPLSAENEHHYVYRFKTSSANSWWLVLEAAGDEKGLGPENTRTLNMAFQHLDLVLELLEARETLRQAATRDLLTGLLSRQELLDQFENERRRALRFHSQPNRTMSLLFIDLDNFKVYNDTFGHASGDWALQRFSQLVLGQVRTLDIFGRYGGDEFLLMLPETTEPGACVTAGRILEAMKDADGFLNELSMQLGRPLALPPDKKLGCSIGIAILVPGHPQNIVGLISQADTALYQAKLNGKGHYAVYKETQ